MKKKNTSIVHIYINLLYHKITVYQNGSFCTCAQCNIVQDTHCGGWIGQSESASAEFLVKDPLHI
jgi:hypothetical protein